MNKNIDYSIIWKYFNSILTQAEQEQLNNWLAESDEHQRYFEALKQRHKSHGTTTPFEVSTSDAWNNIKLTPKRKKQHFWKFGVAASILLIVAVYFGYEALKSKPEQMISVENIQFEPGVKKATLILDNGEKLKLESDKDTLIQAESVTIQNTESKLNYKSTEDKGKKAKTTEYNTLIVPRGGEYHLTLADGTEVLLNSESILKYPVVFEKNQRNIQLIGEAYFDVKTDSLRPFVVSSGDHILKVYGTSFNLKSYKNEDYIATTLVDGKVSVSSIKNTTEQILKPGYQSVYQKELGQFNQQKVNIREYTAWTEGRFYFRNMRLEEMTQVLGRWYDVEFHFNNEQSKDLTFSGNLKKYENIQTILNLLVKTNEITFSAYDKMIYVD